MVRAQLRTMPATFLRLLPFQLLTLLVFTSPSRQASLTFSSEPKFAEEVVVGHVTAAIIEEASGMAASRRHKDVLYVVNDSGGKAEIYALTALNAQLLATLKIEGATNTDWEDLAVGPCGDNGHSCIYIGDIGRNNRQPADTIYRVREPDTLATQTLKLDSVLKYKWDVDDVESLMVTDKGEVYLLSKVWYGEGQLTHVPSWFWGSKTRPRLHSYPKINIHTSSRDPVSADMIGGEILIKTYNNVYYWSMSAGETYSSILQLPPKELPHADEPQGESICWSAAGDGYYTLSEGLNQPLYYFKRIK